MTLTLTLSSPLTLTFQDFERDVSDLPETTIRYLLQYGFRKSLQDAAALSNQQLNDWRNPGPKAKSWAARAAELDVDILADDADVKAAYAAQKTKERLADLDAGEVGLSGTGGRRSELEAAVHSIAWDTYILPALRAAKARDKNRTIPTKAEEIADLVAKTMAGPKGAEIQAKAAAHVAAAKAARDGLDLSALGID